MCFDLCLYMFRGLIFFFFFLCVIYILFLLIYIYIYIFYCRQLSRCTNLLVKKDFCSGQFVASSYRFLQLSSAPFCSRSLLCSICSSFTETGYWWWHYFIWPDSSRQDQTLKRWLERGKITVVNNIRTNSLYGIYLFL